MKKGPFKMKGFSGFGNDSPAKHDDKDLQRDLRERRAENAKPISLGALASNYSGFGPSRTATTMSGAFDRNIHGDLSFAERYYAKHGYRKS